MKKNIYLNLFLFQAIITLTLNSCFDQKKYIYFQKDNNQPDTIAAAVAYVPKIQPGDILSIPINSLNPLASSFFNPISSNPASTDATVNPNMDGLSTVNASTLAQSSSSPSYLVDAEGKIEMPIVGSVKVSGLTTMQAKDTIKKRLTLYLKEPTVNVRFLNYKVSVLGEVMHPGVYVIPNESVSLPEVISMAGDLTPYARHEDILVVRNNDDKKEFGRVNLNSRDIFSSPYYYLHSGDIVYVEQTKLKAAQSDPTVRLLPVILSAFAALALILYRVK